MCGKEKPLKRFRELQEAPHSATESDLWHEFEKTARAKRRRPVELLREVLADFLETPEGVALFDDIARDLRSTGHTEDVELVKAYRASPHRPDRSGRMP